MGRLDRTTTLGPRVSGRWPPFRDVMDSRLLRRPEVCQLGNAKSVRHVDGKTKARAYREYGIEHHEAAAYEIDHRVAYWPFAPVSPFSSLPLLMRADAASK